jgi:hypothetical protein
VYELSTSSESPNLRGIDSEETLAEKEEVWLKLGM